jgi:hypothetical protein
MKKYYALLAKDGNLYGSLSGKVWVTTHKMPTKGFKVVELKVVEPEKKRRQPSKNRYDDL